ncbi:MAG: DEAD/DEAH box helicase family protein [Desulfovibrio sp.]|jgi:type III restriction enzyme|nr:DEAD/DEAH box helicase family protein [Desulfovibrio sp.]
MSAQAPMRLKFKIQPFQTEAVQSVVDCFAGQPLSTGLTYRLDPGKQRKPARPEQGKLSTAEPAEEIPGLRNADLALSDERLLENIQAVQRGQNLFVSDKLEESAGCRCNLDIEMETGTGKTYCYIKTIFELHKQYGWSKYIIMTPSVAIREGVYKSLQITADHFAETYGRKARFFIYNSKSLHELESFSSDSGINVMIINIQAFNATGADNRRIYEVIDDFQSRKPIDVISANRPILILDEPQKMEGPKTLDALKKFRPLVLLRYSATHRKTRNKIHRLDAVDAYNQKLVKKIAVRGITVKGIGGTAPYMFLDSIEVSSKAPVAGLEMEIRQKGGVIARKLKRLGKKDDLFALSGELRQYKGYVVSEIDARTDTVEFANGRSLRAGEAMGDGAEEALRRIQIRETIKSHLDKERGLHARGIKVLSLFFIDEVAKYRDYSREDTNGEYARIFEEEYAEILAEELTGLMPEETSLKEYWQRDAIPKVHEGYFSIDKNKRLVDPSGIKTRGEEAGLSDDVTAYDLILKKKERLLSFEEPVRFIFSHSALREGWDNPNVFGMCMLKHSESAISRRQEVGRGLRLCVNQTGERIDHPAIAHDVNVLTVVANESYKDFVAGLQSEISAALSARPRRADEAYFTGKLLRAPEGDIRVTPAMAKQIYRYLIKNDYTDDNDAITSGYYEAKAQESPAALPSELAPYAEQVFALIDSVYSDAQLPVPEDERRQEINRLNDNFRKQEFKALWEKINRKAVYSVHFDSDELVQHCITAIDKELAVTPLQYTMTAGIQAQSVSVDQLKQGEAFHLESSSTDVLQNSVHSRVRYDLIGKLAEHAQLTRATVTAILSGIAGHVFAEFRRNPEHFITEAARLINEQKATIIIERLGYNELTERYNTDIFTAERQKIDKTAVKERLKKHIYDYVATDSNTERSFAEELDASAEVVVYAKLPRGFLIPTPVGDYNPDWAITFKSGVVRHIYFVAETKGSMSTMQLRKIEEKKIDCAGKFFAKLNLASADKDKVIYEVVNSYQKLMEIVKM